MLRVPHIAQLAAILVMVVHMMVPHYHAWEIPVSPEAHSEKISSPVPNSVDPFSSVDLGIGHLENFQASSMQLLPFVPAVVVRLPEVIRERPDFPVPQDNNKPNSPEHHASNGLRAPPTLA